MLIIIVILLGIEAWWTSSPPITPGTAIIISAILAAHYAVASCLAIACAYRGFLAATAGDNNHAHVADMLKWHGKILRRRLTYWLAYVLWLTRLMAWHLRRMLSRDELMLE